MRDEVAQTLLEKVKKDYSIISDQFDETRQHPWEEFSYFLPFLKKRDSLLDCGCGNGRLFSFLKDKEIEYTGVDNNEDLIKHAASQHPEANFFVADQTQLPFPDETFDHVWNIAAFHHVPSKKLRQQTLAEMKRILKPNGYLMITVWNLWQKKYRKYVIRSLLQNLFAGEYAYNDTFIPWGKEKTVLRYYHAFRRNELEKLLKDQGFSIIKTFFGNNFCFICRKK